MYAIKLKSDTENQRCIKDHIGHNSKTWPAISYREKETQIPEECNIFCCAEQSPDFVCHAIAYSTQKGVCRMYDIEMDRYDEYVEEHGLTKKDEGLVACPLDQTVTFFQVYILLPEMGQSAA